MKETKQTRARIKKTFEKYQEPKLKSFKLNMGNPKAEILGIIMGLLFLGLFGLAQLTIEKIKNHGRPTANETVLEYEKEYQEFCSLESVVCPEEK